MKNRYHPYVAFCAKQRQRHLLRTLPKENHYRYDFSSNDYLGLSQHPALTKAACFAADQEGVGAMASRLLSSHQNKLKALEAHIAKEKQTQAALIFSTGFQANVSVISALLDPHVLGVPPLVFCDKLNHASMHMACRMLNIKQHRYAHLDYEHLTWWLKRTQDERRPRFILTESVFGMDGDIACLEKLIQLSKDYHAFLYVDEAHATGLFGKKGYGLTSDYGNEIDIAMGTFSKALGGSGAYIACSSALKRYFINRSLGLIYSTAPSPMQIAAMHAAWEIVPTFQEKVATLLKQAKQFQVGLTSKGFNTGNAQSHIIPIIYQDANLTLRAHAFLKQKGIRVSAIRPPSVLPNQSRLRIALNVQHDHQAIAYLEKALCDFANECHLL